MSTHEGHSLTLVVLLLASYPVFLCACASVSLSEGKQPSETEIQDTGRERKMH